MSAASRFLTPAEERSARSFARASLAKRREFAEDFDPATFDAWQGWTWGRKAFALSVLRPDPIPARVFKFADLRATEYIAAKGRGSRHVPYRHEHDSPFATIATSDERVDFRRSVRMLREVSSRGAPTARGPSVFLLGELIGLEGQAEDGSVIRWDRPCAGFKLVGCPHTSDMHVIRTGEARKHPPIWILRGRSPYRLTDRGIVR